jgi:gas vesicle protein
MSKSKIALGAVFATVAGFVAGVLTAPKSGKETRADIKDAAVKAKDTAVAEASKAKDVADKKAKEVKAKAEEILDDVKAKAHEVADDVSEKASEIKGRAEQAVEGAKKGYAKKPKSTKK